MNPTPLFEEVEADNIVVAVVVDDGDGIVNRFFPLPLLLLLQLPKRSKTWWSISSSWLENWPYLRFCFWLMWWWRRWLPPLLSIRIFIISQKKKSDQIGWQFDWSSRGWLNWTQMRNIKEYLVRERDREERDACEIRVKEEGVIVMCCWFLFFSVTLAVFQGERNRFS